MCLPVEPKIILRRDTGQNTSTPLLFLVYYTSFLSVLFGFQIHIIASLSAYDSKNN